MRGVIEGVFVELLVKSGKAKIWRDKHLKSLQKSKDGLSKIRLKLTFPVIWCGMKYLDQGEFLKVPTGL